MEIKEEQQDKKIGLKQLKSLNKMYILMFFIIEIQIIILTLLLVWLLKHAHLKTTFPNHMLK